MQLVACSICKIDQTSPVFEKWGFQLVQCRNCGLVYVNPRQFAVEADGYFEGPYLENIEQNTVLRPGFKEVYDRILANIEALLAPGRLMDIGCAMGHFLAHAKDRGWAVHGVESSAYAATYGFNRWGLTIQVASDLRQTCLPPEQFDACTLIEVAEHLPHPEQTFAEIFRLLKPGGVLYVTTPNFSSFRSMLLGPEWDVVIPTGHLYYFTEQTLERVLAASGFVNVLSLGAPGNWEQELQAIRDRGFQLDAGHVRRIQSRSDREDAGKLFNTRGEGLVILCQKPPRPGDPSSARLKPRPTGIDALEQRLVRRPGPSPEDQKVFLVHRGVRRWVTSADWIHQRRMRLEDTIEIPAHTLEALPEGPSLL